MDPLTRCLGLVSTLGLAACVAQVTLDADAPGTTGTTTFENASEGSTQGAEGSFSEDDGWSDDGWPGSSCGFCCAALCPPDGGVPTFECDLWTQDCPRGQKCSPWDNSGTGGWNASKCTPVYPSPDAVGEACQVEGSGTSGVDSCELGAFCWAVDPISLEGTCVQQCMGNEGSPLCPEGAACLVANGGALNVCLPSCEPFGEPCDESLTCRPTQTPGSWVCVPVDAQGVVHDGCGDCGWGELCAAAETQLGCDDRPGCCTTYCDLDDPAADDTCDALVAGHECIPYFETTPDLAHVGICGVARA